MTAEEAIKFNQATEKYLRTKDMFLGAKALQLGIEALKRCRDNYLNPQRADFRRLPGETEE